MTEDQIEPLCQRLYEAVRDQQEDHTAALIFQLLAGFLVDVNLIERSLARLASAAEGIKK